MLSFTHCFFHVSDHFSKKTCSPSALKEQAAASQGEPRCPSLFILGLNLKTGIRVPPSKTEELKATLVTVPVTDIHWCVLLPANLKAAPTNASMPGLPFYCFLSQHPIACQERDTTQNGQVLQSLEHVELSPVDIHKSQHCCEKRQSPELKLYYKDRPLAIPRTILALPHLSTWFLTCLCSSKGTDLRTVYV